MTNCPHAAFTAIPNLKFTVELVALVFVLAEWIALLVVDRLVEALALLAQKLSLAFKRLFELGNSRLRLFSQFTKIHLISATSLQHGYPHVG